MSDAQNPDAPEPQPTVEQAAVTPDALAGTAPPASQNGASAASPPPVPVPADRPELVVGAAFAGGFVLALLLRRLGR